MIPLSASLQVFISFFFKWYQALTECVHFLEALNNQNTSTQFSTQIKIWGPFSSFNLLFWLESHFWMLGWRRDRQLSWYFINAHIVRIHSFNLLLSIKFCLLHSIRFYSNIWSAVWLVCFWFVIDVYQAVKREREREENSYSMTKCVGSFLCRSWKFVDIYWISIMTANKQQSICVRTSGH